MSFSALKYSFLSPGNNTRSTRPQSTRSRVFMFTLPRLMFSSAIISSWVSGSGLISSNACICAMVRLMPQCVPKAPQLLMNCAFASESFMMKGFHHKFNTVFEFSKVFEKLIFPDGGLVFRGIIWLTAKSEVTDQCRSYTGDEDKVFKISFVKCKWNGAFRQPGHE